MNLKKKVAEMEARQQQKEVEWQKILQETKQTSSMEQEYAERKWREALDSKSMEVEKIRLELNTILEAAMAMQHAQLQMHHKIWYLLEYSSFEPLERTHQKQTRQTIPTVNPSSPFYYCRTNWLNGQVTYDGHTRIRNLIFLGFRNWGETANPSCE